jgi:hypothetical protein
VPTRTENKPKRKILSNSISVVVPYGWYCWKRQVDQKRRTLCKLQATGVNTTPEPPSFFLLGAGFLAVKDAPSAY